MKIIPLSEGAFTIDKTKQFIPFSIGNDNLQQRPIGSLLVEIQPFVIITSKDILLLDTGLGFTTKDGVLQIHQNLRDNNIDPGDVTKVLLSHLHKDHAGGISTTDTTSSANVLSFANADYYVNKQEFDYALSQNSALSYISKEFEILSQSANVKYTESAGTIDSYINYEVTSAHSAFHQVFWILEDGQTVFFGGDDAPQLQQMKNRFVAKYDYDGKKCMELRKQWWQDGRKEDWTFLFYHDIKFPTIAAGI